MKKIICKIFGHKIDIIDVVINDIKKSAINAQELKLKEIVCMRCGASLTERK